MLERLNLGLWLWRVTLPLLSKRKKAFVYTESTGVPMVWTIGHSCTANTGENGNQGTDVQLYLEPAQPPDCQPWQLWTEWQSWGKTESLPIKKQATKQTVCQRGKSIDWPFSANDGELINNCSCQKAGVVGPKYRFLPHTFCALMFKALFDVSLMFPFSLL